MREIGFFFCVCVFLKNMFVWLVVGIGSQCETTFKAFGSVCGILFTLQSGSKEKFEKNLRPLLALTIAFWLWQTIATQVRINVLDALAMSTLSMTRPDADGSHKQTAIELAKLFMQFASSRELGMSKSRRQALYALHRLVCHQHQLSLNDTNNTNDSNVDDDDDEKNDDDDDEGDDEFDDAIAAFKAENDDDDDEEDEGDEEEDDDDPDYNDDGEEVEFEEQEDDEQDDEENEFDGDDDDNDEDEVEQENNDNKSKKRPLIARADSEITVDMTPRKKSSSSSSSSSSSTTIANTTTMNANNNNAFVFNYRSPLIARADSEITVDMTPRKPTTTTTNDVSTAPTTTPTNASSSTTTTTTTTNNNNNNNNKPLIARADSEITVDMTPRKPSQPPTRAPFILATTATTTTSTNNNATSSSTNGGEHDDEDPKKFKKLTLKNTKLNTKIMAEAGNKGTRKREERY
jgi:hypothetical protein